MTQLLNLLICHKGKGRVYVRWLHRLQAARLFQTVESSSSILHLKKISHLVQQVFLEVQMDRVISETKSSRNILKVCFSLPYFELSAFASMQTVSNKAGNRERAWLGFFFSKAH